MVSTATIRKTIDIRGTSSGLDETRQKLVALSSAQDGVGVSSAKVEKSQLSLEQAMARLALVSEQNQRQFQQLMQMQQAAAQAQVNSLNSVSQAANDNSRSIGQSGLEWAEWTNHVRSAGEAAYALSPKFRGLVNSLAGPTLGAATKGIELAATGVVRGTNLAGTGLIALAGAAEKASPRLAGVAATVRTTGSALEAFSPTIAGVAGTILGKLVPAFRLLGAVTLVYDAIKMVGEAWELGGKQLDDYRKIAEKAAAVDLSTSYFQKLVKGAEDAKVPVDALTKALTNLQASSADELGGSALQNRLKDSVKVGNFANNPGVALFAQANTTQEKFEAITTLIHKAMEDGQRLAALDIAKTAFGSEAADNLRRDSEYFDKIREAAAKVADTAIVSDADIGNALELQRRYDAAVTILEQRWHPIQDLLTAAGVKMREAWVDIVEAIATAVDWATKLISKLGEAPAWFQNRLNQVGQIVTDATTTPESRKASEQAYGISSNPDDIKQVASTKARSDAVDLLRAKLQNLNAVSQSTNEINEIQNRVWRDTSHAIDDAQKKVGETANQYDRALASIEKHIAQTEADARAVGLSAGAQAELRAEAQLLNAAQQAGIPIDAARAAQIHEIAQKAREATKNLTLLRAQDRANFTSQTMFMSPTDQNIAATMKNIYGPEWQSHMDDALAKQMRMNDLLKEVHDTSQQFTSDLVSGLMSGKNFMDALGEAATNLSKKLADKAITDLFSGNFLQAGIEGVAAIGAAIFGNGQKAKKELQEAQDAWKKMVDQVVAFNLAASGFDLGPLTSELKSLYSTLQTLGEAALKAKDTAGLTSLQNTFNSGVVRIVNQFLTGAQDLSPLAKSIKDVTDESTGLKDTLSQLKLLTGDLSASIDASLNRQIAALTAKFIADTTAGLQADINSAKGLGYINDLTTALAKFNDLADSGVDKTLLQNWLQTSVQKIVDDAGLVGDAFTDFTKQFPQLADIVTESSQALAEAAKQQRDALNASAKSILDYVNGLYAGTGSTLSPQDRLAAAQSAYNAKLVLAQSGNADAQSSITADAENLRQALRDMYGSTEQFQTGLSQIASQLLALPAVTQTDDPVLQVMRDVLTAINVGVASQATDATLISSILPALNAGNAAATATALSTYFNAIDTNTSQSIDFNEMKSALGSMASDSALRAMFTRLDVDNSGSLDRLDLIKVASQASNDNIAQSNALLSTSNSLAGTANSIAGSAKDILSTQATLLDAIKGLNSTAATQLTLLQTALTSTSSVMAYAVYNAALPGFQTAGAFSNSLVDGINKIVLNTYAIAKNTGALITTTNGQGLVQPQLATGGLVRGPGTSTSDSIAMWGSNGEFMVRAAAVESLGLTAMNQINQGRLPVMPMPVAYPAGNDNADMQALLAEVRELRAAVARLDANNVKVTAAGAEAVASRVGDAVDANTEVQRDNNKLARRQRVA